MPVTDCPFSPDEVKILDTFRKVCEEIRCCRFVQTNSNQDHSLKTKKLPDGSTRSEYPAYDKDHFLAFLTHFRKLVANRDRTNIFNIMKLLGKHATKEERAYLKSCRKMLAAEAKNPPIKMSIGPPNEETPYTPDKIQDILFNGQVFHSDEKLQTDLRQLLDFEPFVQRAFLRYAMIVVNLSCQLSDVMENRGYFSDAPEVK